MFPADFKLRVTSKSLVLKLIPILRSIKSAGGYLVRVTFGTALITSVVLVWATVMALLSSRSSDNNNSRSSYSGYSRHGSVNVWFNFTDVLWYWDVRLPFPAQFLALLL